MIYRITWLVLWLAALAGMWAGARHADRGFQDYMAASRPGAEALYDLIPSTVDVFFQSGDTAKEWRTLRKSEFYRAFANLSLVHDALKAWKLDETELSALEKWILQHWGTGLTVAYSRKSETLLVYSPIGRRQPCVEWLIQMQQTLILEDIRGYTTRQVEGHWCVDAELPFLPPGWKAQFFPVRGIGVLAIGRHAEPLAEVLRVAKDREKSLGRNSAFAAFLAKGRQIPGGSFGFLRLGEDGPSPPDLGLQWQFTRGTDGRFLVDMTWPVTYTGSTTAANPDLANLALLRQGDDQLALVSSWDDLVALGSVGSRFLSESALRSLRTANPQLPLSFGREDWEPVLSKLGHSLFVSFGKDAVLSDKFNVTFPRTVIAVPFNEPNQFLRALESSVLKSNNQNQTNLLIRKVAQPYGTYYEVRMGNSRWREGHGLKELPTFSFTNGMLILALNCETMEKALQALTANAAAPAPKIEGVSLWTRTKSLPDTLRLLLAATVIFQPRNENVFVSPTTMRTLNEIFSVAQQFSETDFGLTCEGGRARLQARLAP